MTENPATSSLKGLLNERDYLYNRYKLAAEAGAPEAVQERLWEKFTDAAIAVQHARGQY